MLVSDLQWLLANGSFTVLLVMLGVTAMGGPVPEEATLMAAGALVRAGIIHLGEAAVLCMAVLIVSDLVYFGLARYVGSPLLERRPFRRILPPARRQRLERLFARYGLLVILGGRQVTGLRTAVLAMAGLNRMPLARFLAVDVLALSASGSLMLGLGYLFADQLPAMLTHVQHAQGWTLAVVAGLLLTGGLLLYLRTRRARA